MFTFILAGRVVRLFHSVPEIRLEVLEMVERVEDMLLPNAVVQRIIKEALPAGINVGKEARETISRAASIFVLYLTSTARDQLQLRNQKTLTPADVTLALQKMEMENFVEPLQKAMERKEIRFFVSPFN